VTVEKTISLDLGPDSYDIFIGRELGEFICEWILRIYSERNVYLLVDGPLYDLYEDELESIVRNIPHHVLRVESGEEKKRLESVEKIYAFLHNKGCDRGSLIICAGGGITGDMAGFAAATYMRGIDYVQIPTTLLAQVDSSVGGKTGVNFLDGKNMIGSFFQPRGVFIDLNYLSTIDERNFSAGLAEVLKCGFIGDREIINLLRGKSLEDVRSDEALLLEVISRSVRFKGDIVSRDEREGGLRRVLNFGHTIGHGIEEATSYRKFLHGEAVVAGMAMEGQISLLAGECSEETRNLIIGLIEDMGYELLPEIDYSRVFSLIGRDKKRISKTLSIPVVRGLGECEIREFALSDYEKFAADSLKFLKGFQEAKMGVKLEGELEADLKVLEMAGRFNDAEILIRKQLEIVPTDESLNLSLADLYMKQGKIIAAIKVLEGVIQLNPLCERAISMRNSLDRDLKEGKEDVLGKGGLGSPAETIIKVGDDVYRIEAAEGTEEETEITITGDEEDREVPPPSEEEEEEVPLVTVAMAEVLFREGEKEKALQVLDEVEQREGKREEASTLRDRILFSEKRGKKLKGTIVYLESFLRKIKGDEG